MVDHFIRNVGVKCLQQIVGGGLDLSLQVKRCRLNHTRNLPANVMSKLYELGAHTHTHTYTMTALEPVTRHHRFGPQQFEWKTWSSARR